MKNLVKLKEWTKEEIHEQIINGDIDHDFICEYISSRDRVYNKLIDRVIELESVLKEIREYIDNYDVFKEFSFPLMKRAEENQVKSSIEYEFDTSIKKDLLEIIDKAGIGEDNG